MEELRLLLYPLPLGLIAILLGSVFMARGSRLGGFFWLIGVAGVWLLATEPVSHQLRSQLENQYPAIAAESVPRADAIVVLGGGVVPAMPPRLTAELGHAGDRLRMGFDLYRAERAPVMITTGDSLRAGPAGQSEAAAAAERLAAWGVPGADITTLSDSTTTREDALTVRRHAEREGLGRLILVTSALHMPRSMAVFEAEGLDVIPVPANFESRPEQPGHWSDWLPRARNLWLSTRVWHEHLGMLHYRQRGWVD